MIEKINLRDSYKLYKKNTINPIDVRIYLYIVNGFIKFLMSKVFDGFDVELGGGKSLGVIGVRGRKPEIKVDDNGDITGLPIDWKATKQLWDSNPEAKEKKEKRFFLNEHSNGLSYNLFWWRRDMKIANKRIYYLSFCKPNRRKLSKLIKEGKEYLVN